jgi:hypothetical protein
MDRPALNKVPLEGFGSYLSIAGHQVILTCEHVASRVEINFGVFGSDNIFGYRHRWHKDPPSIDLAISGAPDGLWSKVEHQASAIPYERIGTRHATYDRSEL